MGPNTTIDITDLAVSVIINAPAGGSAGAVDVDPPLAPAGVSLTNQEADSIRVNWGSNSEPDIQDYGVYKSTTDSSSGFVLLSYVATPTTLFVDTNFLEGTQSWYKMTARDNAGNESEFSSVVSSTVNTSLNLAPIAIDEPTHETIGYSALITGSLALDTTATARYRLAGIGTWFQAFDGYRAQRIYNASEDAINGVIAGSLVNGAWVPLVPGNSYDVEVTFSGSDGTDIRSFTTSTRPLPRAEPLNPTIVSVSTSSELSTAISNAAPGHVIECADGTYTLTDKSTNASGTLDNPIYIRSASKDRTKVIMDKNRDPGGASQILYMPSSYWVLEDLTLTANHTSILRLGSNTGNQFQSRNMCVRRCELDLTSYNTGSHTGYGIRATHGDMYGFSIYHNTLRGPLVWPNVTTSSVEGIQLAGEGHSVFENTLLGFGDSLGFGPSEIPVRHNMFARNDIPLSIDDAIELDDGERNCVAYGNRAFNMGMAVSEQPNTGGPHYVFMNAFANTGRSFMKIGSDCQGLKYWNNTQYGTSGRLSNWVAANQLVNYADEIFAGCDNLNNILVDASQNMPAQFRFERTATDYRQDGNGYFPDNQFRYISAFNTNINGIEPANFTGLAGLQASNLGLETNGVVLNAPPFATDPGLGSSYTQQLTSFDPRLISSTNARGAAVAINGLTDVGDDIGAIQYGQPLPVYGDTTSVTPSSVPAWYATMSDNEVKKINVNTLENVPPTTSQSGNRNGVIRAWCGAALDPITGEFILGYSGGHFDYSGNEVCKFPIRDDNPAWSLFKDASPTSTTGGTDPAAYTDGRPRSDHTYNTVLAYNGKFFKIGFQGVHTQPNPPFSLDAGHRRVFTLDMTTGVETDWGEVMSTGGAGGRQGVCYDTTRDQWIMATGDPKNNITGHDLAIHDATTQAFVTGRTQNIGTSSSVNIAHNPVNDTILYRASGVFRVINRATVDTVGWTHANETGSPPQDEQSLNYHPASGKYISWDNENRTFRIMTNIGDPITGTYDWSTVTATGDDIPSEYQGGKESMWGRVGIIPDMGDGTSALFIIPTWPGDVFCWKIPGNL